MTSDVPTVTTGVSAPGWVLWIRSKLDPYLTPSRREAIQRGVAAAVTVLFAAGSLTANEAALWTQLATGTVALLFALLFAGTSIRAALYSVIVVVFGLIQAYGIAQGVDWAIITGAMGYAFGITTAAAKAQPPAAS
jgi:hypothetical protein